MAVAAGEEIQHFSFSRVTPGLVFRIEELAIDGDVEDASSAGDQPEIRDDVLA